MVESLDAYRTAMQMLFAGLVSAPPEDHANG